MTVVEYSIFLDSACFGTRADKRTNRRIDKMYTNAVSYIEKLSAMAKKEYSDDQNPKKRFYFRPYKYTLVCNIGELDERLFSLSLDARLERKGKVINSKSYTFIARRRDGIFIPQKKKKCEKAKCK